MMPEHLVLDAAAFVDLVLGAESSGLLRATLAGRVVHVPAHFDLEVLSALGRLHRSGELTPAEVEQGLTDLVQAPYERHLLAGLLRGAWGSRDSLRLADALYVELARQLGELRLLTTDARLARAVPAAVLP